MKSLLILLDIKESKNRRVRVILHTLGIFFLCRWVISGSPCAILGLPVHMITSDVVYVISLLLPPSFFTQRSSMAAQTNIPPDLSDAERATAFQSLDTDLNSRILYSLLTGACIGPNL